ncbi:MAG: glycosyltransferase family 4 protein [Fibrobacteres bacterium]|nr:glycosyltransferase family 4 protein [Fibrobacterota bacterium]
MEVAFIDPEPPGPAGGGIRTYARLALALCRDAGVPARIYTHSPAAYPGENAFPIGRYPCLPRPLRGLAYRLGYAENVLWEQARWLERELSATDVPGRVYEFADFLGYAFFALRNPRLRPRCLVRVHTPAFLIANAPTNALDRFISKISAWRERDCLMRASGLTAPSAEFMREKLPWLQAWKHVPNPLPPDPASHPASPMRMARARQAERLRAAETAAGPGPVPASGDEAWSAAPPDPAGLAAAARSAARPDRILTARFLYLGRLEPRKGVLPLVLAFARMAGERPFASLTLVGAIGDEAYAEAVKNAIASQPRSVRDRIAWEPPCAPAERTDLFGRHTALVVPSLWENSPYVYFEGMAAGLVCIGSATGEMKAVARATGAPSPRPGDEEAWAGALLAHCDGKDGDLHIAQKAYLASRRAGAAEGLLASWRAALPVERPTRGLSVSRGGA